MVVDGLSPCRPVYRLYCAVIRSVFMSLLQTSLQMVVVHPVFLFLGMSVISTLFTVCSTSLLLICPYLFSRCCYRFGCMCYSGCSCNIPRSYHSVLLKTSISTYSFQSSLSLFRVILLGRICLLILFYTLNFN